LLGVDIQKAAGPEPITEFVETGIWRTMPGKQAPIGQCREVDKSPVIAVVKKTAIGLFSHNDGASQVHDDRNDVPLNGCLSLLK
jgi:hypothetical protein